MMEQIASSAVYLSGLRPGFGGRGLLKSSRLTPCSAALSPAPRTHGRAQSRSHRTRKRQGEGRVRRERRKEGWNTEKKKNPSDAMSRRQSDHWDTYKGAGMLWRFKKPHVSLSWPPAMIVVCSLD